MPEGPGLDRECSARWPHRQRCAPDGKGGKGAQQGKAYRWTCDEDGGPAVLTEPLILHAYQKGLEKFNLGYTSALSFAFLIIVLVFGAIYLALLRPQIEKRIE